ncbi:MAG TPA: 4-alpha-glucanotransferase [Dermatophilaceae bacterium]|nr:4-alpha-glucanotransferase [Dermatophilaceae bacterium]
MTDAPSPALAELARAYGVATDYWDWQGNHVIVAAETIVAVLAALDVDATSDAATWQALDHAHTRSWRRTVPPIVVCREGWTPWVPVHLPDGQPVRAWVELEDGSGRDVPQVQHWVAPRSVDGQLLGEATFEIPGDLPIGWHTLVVRVNDEPEVRTPLVVSPAVLKLPPALWHRRAFGLMSQFYSVRSQRSWGVGDVADLAEMSVWAATELGADFVLVNPLHAAEPVAPLEPSPYLPTTRRFANPLYIRVEDVPEIAYLSAAERQIIEWHAEDVRKLNTTDQIDRDAAWAAKSAALRTIFNVPRGIRRETAFRAYKEREGQGLVDFATWSALSVKYGMPWGTWPPELHDPRGAGVAAERQAIAEEVDFYCWLQWVLDEQLDALQLDARAAGMPIGLVHDLAVGVHPEGADSWGLADALARYVTVGAPPDPFNQMGQDWSQPPWRPDRLEELAYQPYRDMLRTVLRHAGGIRIDHVIGLFRLWWVPAGKAASQGTYVRYDHEALMGILALEAHRAGAVVVGEDLGVVEPWVRDYMRERGMLGTSIMWFEKGHDRRPLQPEQYRELCLATVTTHDLPPTAGYLAGVHIDVREQLGLFTRPVEEERAEDEADRTAMLELLESRGLLRPGGSSAEVVEALHRFLSWTPAKMLGVAVPDLVGDKRAMNQPGTNTEYPNWKLALTSSDGSVVMLEDLMGSRWAKRLGRIVAQR